MARKCKVEDPNRFVLTLPLCCEPWQRDRLDKLFRVGNEIKNHLIAYEKKQLAIVTRRKDYRALQSQLADAYKAKDTKRIKELGKQRTSLLESAGFTAGAFETQANRYRLHYCRKGGKGCMVHAHVSQKIAASVWKAFEDYLYGTGKDIRFSKWTEFTTLSCKEAGTGYIYRGNGIVEINKMVLHASIDKKDRYGYQEEALKRDVRFCSIVRRWYENGWKYFLQLVLVGKPPVKVRPETGELLHALGKGRVGHDIGTQTLASCGEEAVQLVELADRVQAIDNELRRVNRAMDRSRRATNPKMFDSKGRIIPINKLPQECLTPRKTRRWIKSKRYRKLESKRRVLYRKQAECRIQQHRELANKLLAFGDEHYIEEMRFRALARRAKEDRVNEKGKHLSKKRFGKSIANKAPATFVKILKRKVIEAGGTFQEVNTFAMKASQYNHLSQTYTKKALSKRWNLLDGKDVQRDLYSAFLIKNTTPELNHPDDQRCKDTYPAFLILHDKEIERLKHIVTPSSTGVKHTA